jgi:hypothetical protein
VEITKMRKILGTLAAVLAVGGLAGFVIAGASAERDTETGLDYAVGRGELAGISGDGIEQDDMVGSGGVFLADGSFQYDALGRLSASATFDYDRYGNRSLASESDNAEIDKNAPDETTLSQESDTGEQSEFFV